MAVSYAIILWQIRIFPHSRLIIEFVTRVTRRVPLMEQELSTLLEHPSSPSHIVGFVLLNLYVVFCRSLFVLSSFIFQSLYSFSIYASYLHIFHMIHHFQQYFSYIIKVSYISGGNQLTQKFCHNLLTNFTAICIFQIIQHLFSWNERVGVVFLWCHFYYIFYLFS